jgi:ATP-dependent DNA helicase PIF1
LIDFKKLMEREGLSESPQIEAPIEPEIIRPADDPTFHFICGTAGTGKTFQVREQAQRDPSCILAATTGIAAVNLGDATTINAALGYFDTKALLDMQQSDRLTSTFRKYAESGITHWIVDEVSMMDSDSITAIVSGMVQAHRILQKLDKGFRPLALTIVGDFAQLPPVKGKFAFECGTWRRFEDKTTILREIKRQTDLDFIEALQHARRGDGRKAVEYFEPFMVMNAEMFFDGTTIVGLNREVEAKNRFRIEHLDEEMIQYRSSRWYDEEFMDHPPGEWRNIPEILELKQGCLVMILANKRDFATDEFEYVNGDLGKIESFGDKGVYVELVRTGEIVYVEYVRRETKKPTGKKREPQRVVAWIEYLPLRLAYSTTVHKSQGLTLDRVQLVFRHRFFATPGMLYVGLSRVRTPKGLILVGTPEQFIERCNADLRVGRWL